MITYTDINTANTSYSLTNSENKFLVNGQIINAAVNFNNNVPI